MKKIIIISGAALTLIASSYMGAQMYIEKKVSDYLANLGGNSQVGGISFVADSVYYNPFKETFILKGVKSKITNNLIKQNINSISLESMEFTYPISTFFGANNLINLGDSFAKINGGHVKFSPDALERFLSGIGMPPFLKEQGIRFNAEYTASVSENNAQLRNGLYIEEVGEFNISSEIIGPFDEVSEIIDDAEVKEDGSLNLTTKQLSSLEIQFKKFAGKNVSFSFKSEGIIEWLNFLSKVSPLVSEGDLHGVNNRIKLDLERNGLFSDDYINALYITLSDAIDTKQDVKFSFTSGVSIDMHVASQLFMIIMAGNGTPETLSNLIKAEYNLELIKFKKP